MEDRNSEDLHDNNLEMDYTDIVLKATAVITIIIMALGIGYMM